MVWAAKSGLQSVCIFRLVRVSNLRAHRTESVFALKSIVGWGEHKVVLDKRGFRECCVDVNWGLNLLSVSIIFLTSARVAHLHVGAQFTESQGELWGT